jgi:DNA-binding NtrC family response regulator
VKKTVLVVDDQPGTRKLLRNVLEDCGYDVIDAEDGSTAWRVARAHRSRIDVALLDVELQGIKSGPYLAVGLRAMLDASVIFMSGHQREALVSNQHLPASAAFVQKPFKLHEVREAVAKAFDEHAVA